MRIDLALRFPKGLIQHPYWPSRERVIQVEKESGTRRARSEQNRARALQDYLNAHDLTVDDYEVMRTDADRQFYTWADVTEDLDGHDPTEIVVPAHQLWGCLAQAADLASSSVRLARAEQIRTVLTLADGFATGCHESDAKLWQRYVVVTAGTGSKLSNQRALRENQYLPAGTTATGWLRFSEHIVDPAKVRTFLEFAGREIGCGASRKLGWGRFDIVAWDEHA
jgi:hypothetical protein